MYNTSSRHEQGTYEEHLSERHDPLKRYRIKKNANDDFHESSLYKDSQFENELET